MPKIMLKPEFLTQKADELGKNKISLDDTMKRIQQLADQLPAEWEGKAQKAFMESYESKKQVYKDFSIDLERFSQFLKDYAATMDTADTGGADDAKTLA